jgi:type I restriction enzyme, S subunit
MMTSHEWKAAKLDQLGFVGRGKSRHRPRNADFLYGGPYPFFQTGDIKAAHFHLTDHSQTYSAEGLAQSKLWRAGTLCITIAANIAETAILGVDGCFPDSVVGFIADPAKADVRFIKYYMDTLKLQMQSASRGTTQDNLSLDKLLTFDFLVPDLTVQRRIADILSAYDELIENNQRRIRILETMARSLYREWFVHFRFPGHEKVRRLPSTLGKIPEGWKVQPLGELASITMGLSPKGDTYNEFGDGTPLVNGPVEFGERFTKPIKWTSAPTKLCKAGALVVCVRGSTTGKYVKSDGVYCLGRGVCSIESKYQSFVDLLFAMELPTLLAQAGGSTFPSWTGPQLQSHLVLSPSTDVMDHFEKMVRPMSELIAICSRKIESLRRTRDLLLPRLLSGRAAVADKQGRPEGTDVELIAAISPSEATPPPLSIETPSPIEMTRITSDSPAVSARSISIEDTDRTEVLCAIRTLFNDDQERGRDAAIRELAHALGYQRTGSRVYEVLSTDLLTAVRRGIIANVGGVYRRGFRTLADCTRDSLKKDFEFAIGRGWISREDAIRALARWLGFRRVGPVIDETARSLINGLIREGRLEADGSELIRRR